MNAFDQTLLEYGADLEAVCRFDGEDRPELLPYANLQNDRHTENSALYALLGVAEWQGNPLIFLVDGEEINDRDLQEVRRKLALRGDAPYLGVVKPGQLAVHRVALDDLPPLRSLLTTESLPAQPKATFAWLANNRPEPSRVRGKWISQVVLGLLKKSIDSLIEDAGVSNQDAISLVGRALFTRFLADRDLLPASLVSCEVYNSVLLFDTAEKAERTSIWLDDTFNGDFLPLSEGLFHTLPDSAYHALGNILRRTEDSQLYLDWQEDWAHLDFAHIPVGVLSQAYESYLRTHHGEIQRKEGGYYTPRIIADMMVRGAFHALVRDGRAHEARVLDPAAGAGVFLLMAFRRLVGEVWRREGKRPDTATLRKILYQQITGFDINESALRFAALGLYLLSIELDPNPEPVQKLRFENLRGRVLHKVGEDGGLGSLGDGVGAEHVGRYHLVIGNPPWSSATQLADWSQVKARVANIAKARLPEGSPPPPLPNEPLDLPFVWRAMEWARPGGQIAFALPARLLFYQAWGYPIARHSIFQALDVTGVVNGADLCGTRVWPEIAVPFCLLFARNYVPGPSSAFRFVSPHLEDRLNGTGNFRLDAANAEWATWKQLMLRPEVLKILFRGGPLDLEVYERMASRNIGTLHNYWRRRFGGQGKRIPCAGNGYKNFRPENSVCYPSDHLIGMPDVREVEDFPLLIPAEQLPKFNQSRLHRIRSKDLFKSPLLLVKESSFAEKGRIRAFVADEDVLFSQSFHGYSARKHPQGHLLVRYLALLISSRPAYWHVYMTSGRFGVERRVVEKRIFENISVVPFEELPDELLNQVEPLFDALVQEDTEENWARVDAWAAAVYGLRESDLQIIADTLRFNLPYEASWRAAQTSPSDSELLEFCSSVEAVLLPWAQKTGKAIKVFRHPLPADTPWALLRIHAVGTEDVPKVSSDWPEVLNVADQTAATEVLMPDEGNKCLWVARLNQARYWSRSQARLLARCIVWEHLDQLLGAPSP